MSHPESDAYFIGASITTDSMGVYKGILAVAKTEIMSASVGKLEVCVPGRSYHVGLITLWIFAWHIASVSSEHDIMPVH